MKLVRCSRQEARTAEAAGFPPLSPLPHRDSAKWIVVSVVSAVTEIADTGAVTMDHALRILMKEIGNEVMGQRSKNKTQNETNNNYSSTTGLGAQCRPQVAACSKY